MANQLNYKAKPARGRVSDDVAYMLPMAVFLAFIWVGGHWKSLYASSYLAREISAAALMIVFAKRYTRIRWDYWWLGIIVGVIGIFQWVPMQLWLQRHWDIFKPGPDAFNPMDAFKSPAVMWGFIVVRIAGAVIFVPFMEE